MHRSSAGTTFVQHAITRSLAKALLCVLLGQCVGAFAESELAEAVYLPVTQKTVADAIPRPLVVRHEGVPAPSAAVPVFARRATAPEVPGMLLAALPVLDFINQRREFRFTWRGSPQGFREHALKVRVSRNHSTVMWQAAF